MRYEFHNEALAEYEKASKPCRVERAGLLCGNFIPTGVALRRAPRRNPGIDKAMPSRSIPALKLAAWTHLVNRPPHIVL